jgi:hypothetical protein
VHPGHRPTGQVDQSQPLPGFERLGGSRDQRRLIARVDQLPGLVVEHHQVRADPDHGAPVALAGGQVVVQQGQLPWAGLVQQGAFDLPGDTGHRRGHEPSGVRAPAGQIDDAEQLAGHRVPDRGPGAGEVGQVLHVVLVPEDLRRAAPLQRGTDAVGADEALRVGEARGQPHLVQVLVQRRVPGAPLQHHTVGVGEDHAHRLAGELVGHVGQHR